LGVLLQFFLVKSVTLAYKGLDAEGVNLNLVTIGIALANLARPGLGHGNGPLGLLVVARS
jgi:hypothetical protein